MNQRKQTFRSRNHQKSTTRHGSNLWLQAFEAIDQTNLAKVWLRQKAVSGHLVALKTLYQPHPTIHEPYYRILHWTQAATIWLDSKTDDTKLVLDKTMHRTNPAKKAIRFRKLKQLGPGISNAGTNICSQRLILKVGVSGRDNLFRKGHMSRTWRRRCVKQAFSIVPTKVS